MNRFISQDNLHHFCTTNEKWLKGDIKKLVIEFPGHDGNSCLGGNLETPYKISYFAETLGENGILSVFAFPGPWSWMRRISFDTIEQVIDCIFEKYSLPSDIPIVLMGGSMGGHGALMYSLKTSRKITACAVSCPACDLYALSQDKTYPFFCASVYLAFADCDGDFETILKAQSPLYNADKLPRIPYFMIVCDSDAVIPCDVHALPFLEKMREAGHNIRTITAEGKGHCEHPIEIKKAFSDFIINA